MSTAPNPFSEQFKAVIYPPQSGDVVFDLSDVNGSSVFNNRLPATNGVSVPQAAQLEDLQAGFYLLRIFERRAETECQTAEAVISARRAN